MTISFDRKILNRNNIYLDDRYAKYEATPAQVKRSAKRGKKTLKLFWAKQVKDDLIDIQQKEA